ncbi:MAG: hypothetical protein J1E39_06130 [Eubacterium sp.]|nr:hypothetical protein [Eubacterium sp.]
MPFINVKTNVSVPDDSKTAIKSALGQAITAIPGKSERWLMVGIEPEYSLYFQGTDSPAAIAEVSVYGHPSPDAMNSLTGKITDILSDTLALSPDRIYVSYAETDNWGWNGCNL